MWKSIRTINRIEESISGYSLNGNYMSTPYYIRINDSVDPYHSIEYTMEKPAIPEYPEDIFNTPVGRIQLSDEGEFGGYLRIGKNHICNGNFSKIFEYKGSKYVIDDLKHMMSYYFRLIKINDNGTAELIFDGNEYTRLHKIYEGENPDKISFSRDYYFGCNSNASKEDIEKYKLNLNAEVGLDAYCIENNISGDDEVYFLCSGYVSDFSNGLPSHETKVQYLLIYNPDNPKPIVKIMLPLDKVGFYDVTSIWSDGMMLIIGCDKQVVVIHLPDMSVEYRTELSNEEVEKLINEKRK